MTRNLPPPIRSWFKYRIWALATLALYSIRFGLSYTPLVQRTVPNPPALEFITAIFPNASGGGGWQPIYALGIGWFVLGLAAFAAMVTDRLHNLVFLATAAFTLYWTLAYFTSQVVLNRGNGDAYTAVFLMALTMMIVLLGLLTRPSAKPDPTPLRTYREDNPEGHHRAV